MFRPLTQIDNRVFRKSEIVRSEIFELDGTETISGNKYFTLQYPPSSNEGLNVVNLTTGQIYISYEDDATASEFEIITDGQAVRRISWDSISSNVAVDTIENLSAGIKLKVSYTYAGEQTLVEYGGATLYADESSAVIDGVAHYWDLNELSGSICYNKISGNSNLTSVNTTPTTGLLDSCRLFNGTNSSYLYAENITGFTSVSFAFWLKTTYVSGAINQRYFNTGNAAASLDFVVAANGTAYYTPSNPPLGSAVISLPNRSDGNWHHYCFTSTSGSHKIYMDGSPVSFSNETNGISPYFPGRLTIGSKPTDGSYINYEGGCAGYIDEIVIYNRIIDQSKVSAIYNSGTGIKLF